MKKYMFFIFSALLTILIYSSNALAAGECGLSCCLAGAATSGVTLAGKFGLSVQYEYSAMKTIKEGTDEVSPDEVISRKWMIGGSYSVPTEMTMEKLSFVGAYPATDKLHLIAVVPYIRNNMDMRMKDSMGMLMDRKMDTIEGLGDVTVMGLYTAYSDAPVRPRQRVTIGLGVKTPTGVSNETTSTGTLVHAMMQAGSGSWDPLFMLNYMKAYYPLVLQGNIFYHLTTKGNEGYEFGDQLSLDLIARYQVQRFTNVGLEINGIHTAKDKDHDGKFSKPATSMVDNITHTGLTSVFVTPVVQFKIPKTGGSAELKYQLPIYQEVNGIQQVLDWKALASIVWNF